MKPSARVSGWWKGASPFVALILVALGLMSVSIAAGGVPTDSATLNLVWTRQIGDAFANGEVYPRWLPQSFEGLGSPAFYFYPPIAFFLSGAFNAAGLSLEQSINGAAFLTLLGSGVTMYAWLSYRGTRPLLGAILYMAAPYHQVDFYARGDLAEFSAFLWLPLIALGLEALPKRWGAVLLAVSWAGLMLTHLPMALLVSLFLIAPLASLKAWRDRRVIAPGLIAAALGLSLAAIYLLPALSLQRHVSMDMLWTDRYRPQNWLFIGWRNPPPFFLCLPLGAAAACLVALRARSIWTGLTLAAALGAFGLIPIWHLPVLEKVQFSWRVLAVVEFAAVTALAAAPPRLIVRGTAMALTILSYIMMGLLVAGGLRAPKPWYAAELAEMRDAVEYLPAGIAIPDSRKLPDLAVYRSLPRPTRSIVVTKAGAVTLRLAAFPIWQITRDSKPVPSRGPLLTFDGAPGVYRLERVTTPQETLGAAISVLALLTRKSVV